MNDQPPLPGMSPPVPSLAEILRTLEIARGYLQQRQQQHQAAANNSATPTTAIYHSGMSNALLGEIMIVEQQIMNLRQQQRAAPPPGPPEPSPTNTLPASALRESPPASDSTALGAGNGCSHPLARQDLQADGAWRCKDCGAVSVHAGNRD